MSERKIKFNNVETAPEVDLKMDQSEIAKETDQSLASFKTTKTKSDYSEVQHENPNDDGCPVEVPMPGLARWSEMRLKWNDKEQKSWNSFDFRASFDGTKSESLVDDSLRALAKKNSLIEDEAEQSNYPKQFLIQLKLTSLKQFASLLSLLHKKGASLVDILGHPLGDYSCCAVDSTSFVTFRVSSPGSLQPLPQIGDLQLTIEEEIWFPRTVNDLNKCRNVLSSVEPSMDKDHPGFNDVIYRKRRKDIAELAVAFRHGNEIPVIEYTPTEIETWKEAFENLTTLYPTHACKDYQKYLHVLQQNDVIMGDEIPQLRDLSAYLQGVSGFRLCPVSGLVSARDFLACLAFRVFPCTQYIRHHAAPMHSPEPDLIHEVLGHVVMFMDDKLADFSQKVGQASLGASDEDILKLATLYWFTVEFGLVREDGCIKAYGAGLLSSYGELEYALSDEPEHSTFETSVVAVQPYDDYNYQQVYFVIDSFQSMHENFERFWSANLSGSARSLFLDSEKGALRPCYDFEKL